MDEFASIPKKSRRKRKKKRRLSVSSLDVTVAEVSYSIVIITIEWVLYVMRRFVSEMRNEVYVLYSKMYLHVFGWL